MYNLSRFIQTIYFFKFTNQTFHWKQTQNNTRAYAARGAMEQLHFKRCFRLYSFYFRGDSACINEIKSMYFNGKVTWCILHCASSK